MYCITSLRDLPRHNDKRGEIQMVLENFSIGSISRITSMPETTRANHWHENDYHWILVNEGMVLYYEREVGSLVKPREFILVKDDMFLTHPKIEHTMYFPCYTVFDCYSKLPRNQSNYEEDTVRFNYSLKDIFDNYK